MQGLLEQIGLPYTGCGDGFCINDGQKCVQKCCGKLLVFCPVADMKVVTTFAELDPSGYCGKIRLYH